MQNVNTRLAVREASKSSVKRDVHGKLFSPDFLILVYGPVLT